MFCDNPACHKTTFAENFNFIDRSQKKTKRLIQHIVDVSNNMSSLSTQRTLRKSGVQVVKSTICTFLKR